MTNKDRQKISRFIEQAQEKVGSTWGWQKRLSDLLEISPSQLNNILAGRSPLGPGIRERLLAKGFDVDRIQTGKESELKKELARYAKEHPGTYIPENLPEKTRKQVKLMIEEISKLDEGEIERAREIIRTIFKTKKGR